MKTRFILALVVVPALVGGTAIAQTATSYTEIEDDARIVEPFDLSVDRIDDMNVFGPDGEQIGEVEDVLADGSGKIVGFAVETEGFAGLGDEDVILGLDQIELAGDRFVTSLTKEQIGQLPTWND